MRRIATMALVAAVMVFPVGASAAGNGGRGLAERDCKQERLGDPGEYRRVYGESGKGLDRCIRDDSSDAL